MNSTEGNEGNGVMIQSDACFIGRADNLTVGNGWMMTSAGYKMKSQILSLLFPELCLLARWQGISEQGEIKA